MIMAQNNTKPWKRLPTETSKQYNAFCIYRDLGPGRSIQKVANKRSGSGGLSKLKEWSSKYLWIERAAAYDEHLDGVWRSGFEEEIHEMAARHAREAKLFQEKVHERLEKIDPDELKPHELIKWYETGVKIERLSRGVSTENVKREEFLGVKEDVITVESLEKPEIREKNNHDILAYADSKSSANGAGFSSE